MNITKSRWSINRKGVVFRRETSQSDATKLPSAGPDVHLLGQHTCDGGGTTGEEEFGHAHSGQPGRRNWDG
jgi:hypothetical protein